MRISESCARCLYEKQLNKTDNEEYLAKIKNIIEIKAKVDQLIEEVDEDMGNHDVKDAHAKIVECQQMLKRTTGPFNNAVKKIRNGVVNRERKLAALNRKLRQEEREKRMQDVNAPAVGN